MKSLKYLSALILSFCLFSCEPIVTFTEPQPAQTSSIKKIPFWIRGNYVSLSDNSTLAIGKTSIQRIYDYDYKIHPNQLDSSSKLSGDTLINFTDNEKTLIKRDGDSLIAHIHEVDTLFVISEDNVLKKYKRYYFLNINFDDEAWEVKKMQLSKGQLTISTISTELDLENLKTITESANDTISPYSFTPSKKQFKTFVAQDGFSEEEIFVKLKK